MSRRVLVSFLGKGTLQKSGGRGYERTVYRFDDGFTCSTSFFGWAALRWHHRTAEPPGAGCAWVLLGTMESTWQQLLDVAEDLGPPAEAAVLAWVESLQAVRGSKSEFEARCMAFEREIAPVLGLDMAVRLVDHEPRTLLGVLDECLGRSDRVELDITHGWRSLPVVAATVLQFLRWSKGIQFDRMLYGAFDFPRWSDDAVRVAAFESIADLLAAIEPLALLSLTGRVGPLADLMKEDDPNLARELREADYLDGLSQFNRAIPKINAVRKRVESKAEDPLKSALRSAIVDATEWSRAGDDARKLLARGRLAVKRRSWMQALVVATEACKLAVVPYVDADPRDVKYDEKLGEMAKRLASERSRQLGEDLKTAWHMRNAAAHGDISPGEGRSRLFEQNPEVLEQLLTRVLDFAESLAR